MRNTIKVRPFIIKMEFLNTQICKDAEIFSQHYSSRRNSALCRRTWNLPAKSPLHIASSRTTTNTRRHRVVPGHMLRGGARRDFQISPEQVQIEPMAVQNVEYKQVCPRRAAESPPFPPDRRSARAPNPVSLPPAPPASPELSLRRGVGGGGRCSRCRRWCSRSLSSRWYSRWSSRSRSCQSSRSHPRPLPPLPASRTAARITVAARPE